MSSGGGSAKQTGSTTQSSSLMPSIKSGIDTALGGAKSQYDSGSLFQTYPNSTVVPYSFETANGMNGIMANSLGYADSLRNNFAQQNALASGDGFNDTQRGAIGNLQGIASGATGIDTGGMFQSIYDRAGAPSNAESNLGAFASGQYLDGSNNPYFSKVVDRASEGARDAVNMNFSGAGRYGSGANQQILAREVGDLQNRAYADQYNNEVANMFGANSQMDAQRAQRAGIQQGAAAGLTGVQGQNIANRMSATGDLFNAGQQGYSNKAQAIQGLPAAFQGSLAPYEAMMGVGAMNEDLTTRQMNDQMRLWQGQADQPRLATEWLAGLSTGAGGLGQTTQQQSYAPKTSPFMSGLGGAAAGFGMAGPVGGAIGGGLGLLGGLF